MRRLGFGRVTVRITQTNRFTPRREAIQDRKKIPTDRLAPATARVIVAITGPQRERGKRPSNERGKSPSLALQA